MWNKQCLVNNFLSVCLCVCRWPSSEMFSTWSVQPDLLRRLPRRHVCSTQEAGCLSVCLLSASYISVIVTSLWLLRLCDCDISVIVASVCMLHLCDCDICVIVTSVWLLRLCDCDIYVIVTSVWLWHLCDCDICLHVKSVWLWSTITCARRRCDYEYRLHCQGQSDRVSVGKVCMCQLWRALLLLL